MIIKNIKLIHATGKCDIPDDESYPWRLNIVCSPPQFMTMAFIGIYGGNEKLVVRGKTKEVLEEFVKLNNYKTHPRLTSLKIHQPEINEINEINEIKREK